MKKNLTKIFTSASIVVAVILIMILLVTTFGGIEFKEFESSLVRGLIITLAILYLLLAGIALALMFINSDVVKDVVIRTEKGGSVRVSAQVITKIVKDACKDMEGVKCKKVIIVQDDYGVRLKVNVKIVDKDVIETETYLRFYLEDMFIGEFGFRFESIEIRVMVLTPKYKSDSNKLAAQTAEKVEEIKAAQEAALAEAERENAAKAEQTASVEEQSGETETEQLDEETDTVDNAADTEDADGATESNDSMMVPQRNNQSDEIAEVAEADEDSQE